MRVKPSLVPLSLALCCLCAWSALAQGGEGAPAPVVPPPTPLPAPVVAPTPSARAVEDASAPAGWKRYEFKYGGGDAMSVFFPKAPDESVEKSALPDGSSVVVHLL